jgi:transaldolase
MPEPTLHALAKTDTIRGETVRATYQDAQAVLDQLTQLGIDYHEVVDHLERDGLDKFQTSWTELLEAVSEAMSDRGRDASDRSQRQTKRPR